MALKALNELMQEGFKRYMDRDSTGACDVWIQTWEGIEREMDERGIATVQQFDPVFDGEQLIVNWAPQFEMALYNASLEDREYARMRIAFCGAYLGRMSDPNDENGLNMRRAIAEAHYKLGESREGEAVFRALTEEHPTWAWGWIGWAEQYGSFGEPEHRDAQRGIAILKEALDVPELEERDAVLGRLQDLYLEAGMTQEAEAVGKALRGPSGAATAASAKAGKPKRNDPCSCGSGKKYKKCCGA